MGWSLVLSLAVLLVASISAEELTPSAQELRRLLLGLGTDDTAARVQRREQLNELKDYEQRIMELCKSEVVREKMLCLNGLQVDSLKESFFATYLRLLRSSHSGVQLKAISQVNFWASSPKREQSLKAVMQEILFNRPRFQVRYPVVSFLMGQVKTYDEKVFRSVMEDKMAEIAILGIHGLGNLVSHGFSLQKAKQLITQLVKKHEQHPGIRQVASYYLEQ